MLILIAKTRRYCEDGHLYDADPFVPCCPKAGKKRSRQTQHRQQPRRLSTRVRNFVKLRDGGRCRYCGGPGTSVDHVVARCNEGADDAFDNMVWCCKRCNDIKGREEGFTMKNGRLYWHNRLVEQGELFGEALLVEVQVQREARQVDQGLHAIVNFKRRGGTR